jgi:hypothetical protein
MNVLFILLLSICSKLHAAPEIFHSDDSKQIASNIKDIEIQELLAKTREFDDCRKENEFKTNATESERNDSIKRAQECFRSKLSGKDPKKLEELSDLLGLQQYGLVKSKNLKEIQTYLNNKMYKSMTGVDLEETNKKKFIDSLKFKNKKHIDQSIFIEIFIFPLDKIVLGHHKVSLVEIRHHGNFCMI